MGSFPTLSHEKQIMWLPSRHSTTLDPAIYSGSMALIEGPVKPDDGQVLHKKQAASRDCGWCEDGYRINTIDSVVSMRMWPNERSRLKLFQSN